MFAIHQVSRKLLTGNARSAIATSPPVISRNNWVKSKSMMYQVHLILSSHTTTVSVPTFMLVSCSVQILPSASSIPLSVGSSVAAFSRAKIWLEFMAAKWKKKTTWGRGWMTKASGVGERRKGRGELRRDCHHRVAALFVPTRMQQWYMIYDI